MALTLCEPLEVAESFLPDPETQAWPRVPHPSRERFQLGSAFGRELPPLASCSLLVYPFAQPKPVLDAVLGNAATLISFRLGPHDAGFIAKEFQPEFDAHDLMMLPNYHIYLKLMIDGTPSKPFSGETLKSDYLL